MCEPYSEDICPRYRIRGKITRVIFWHQMLAPSWNPYSMDKSPRYRVCTGNFLAQILAPKIGANLELNSEEKSPRYFPRKFLHQKLEPIQNPIVRTKCPRYRIPRFKNLAT